MADGTPKGFKTSEIVELSDGSTVTVKKWSYTRAIEIMKFLGASWRDLLSARAALAAGGGGADPEAVQEALTGLLEFLGPKALQFVRLSIDKPTAVGEETTLEDMLDLVSVVLELNVTEKLVKKAKALLGTWKRLAPTEGP